MTPQTPEKNVPEATPGATDASEAAHDTDARVRELEAEVERLRKIAHPVPGLHIPIPAPDYTMRTGTGHDPLPNRNSTSSDVRKAVERALDLADYWGNISPGMPMTRGHAAAVLREVLT